MTLRPASLADLDAFEQRFDSAEDTRPYQWFGHTSMQHLRAMWEELAGRVDFFEKAWGRPDTSTCWEIA